MSNKVYGIDLGTTYSCIAYVDEYGKPTVIPNSDGELTTPSVVYFESEDNIVVGKTAKEISELYPDQVVSIVKRVMGDEQWSFSYGENTYAPQELSSHILRKIVADAETELGENIQDVVITVPAYFGVNQKEATKQAGELAGLNVLYVIPEPTAAAIAYGMEQEENQTIMVYDLGGGTFDITAIEIQEGAITVISTGGDHNLGGRNWDESLAHYFAQCFADETGVETEELTDDPETWQELLNSAEKCKRDLSNREKVIEKVSFEGDRIKVELSREKFEEITSSWMENTLSLTEELLETIKNKGHSDIDKLLLVGGSSYMPHVKENLGKRFPFEISLYDPNQAVAKGAALFGYKCYLDELTQEQIKIIISGKTGETIGNIDLDEINLDEITEEIEEAQKQVASSEGIALPGLKKLTETTIVNVSSKSFGIVVLNENEDEVVSNLILVDDPVPKEVVKQFPTAYDNQNSVMLKCIESINRTTGDETFDLDPTQEIGKAELNFSYALPKGSLIEITFSLTPDGLLSIHALDLTTNNEISVEFDTNSILSQEELETKKTHNLAISVSS